MALVEASGLPISILVTSANPHESQLALDVVLNCWTESLPRRVIGDKAYDSDSLDTQLAEYGVEMIAAHRKNRLPANKTQDGRPLRRAKRRWKVERFFAWSQEFRRIVTRWEYKLEHFIGFVQLATIIILIRNCF